MNAATAIVLTTIHPPGEAVRAFAGVAGHRLIVVGDRRTPVDWACPGAEYLAPDRPTGAGRLFPLLPFDHYGRKMLGYLRALESGAAVLVDTDDDNFPKPGWSFPPFDGRFRRLRGDRGFVNIYRLFTGLRIWPRGFPLELVRGDAPIEFEPGTAETRVGAWQGLVDGDPDVDAIYRLTVGEPCTFAPGEPVTLGPGTHCPFNSQNTAFRREIFPLLYLPVHVSFRFTDILRGMVAQPIMAAAGFRLGFTAANAVQRRNPHDPMLDFVQEIPMYRHARRALEIASAETRPHASMSDNLVATYRALRAEAIVEDAELAPLEAWLDEVGRAMRAAG